MKPIDFHGSNFSFDKPEGMTDEECEPLPVYHGILNGLPVNISCWEPTDEEIQEIVKSKKVWLYCYGMTQQPVALSGNYPFEEVKNESD